MSSEFYSYLPLSKRINRAFVYIKFFPIAIIWVLLRPFKQREIWVYDIVYELAYRNVSKVFKEIEITSSQQLLLSLIQKFSKLWQKQGKAQIIQNELFSLDSYTYIVYRCIFRECVSKYTNQKIASAVCAADSDYWKKITLIQQRKEIGIDSCYIEFKKYEEMIK